MVLTLDSYLLTLISGDWAKAKWRYKLPRLMEHLRHGNKSNRRADNRSTRPVAMRIQRASGPGPNKDTLRTSRTTWKERKYEQSSTAETTECMTAWRKPHGNVWPIRNLHLHPGITWLRYEFRGCEDYGIARIYRCTGQSYRYPFLQMGKQVWVPIQYR